MREFISADLLGSKALEDAFKQLPKATSKSTLKRVLRKRAEPIAEEAERNAPKGKTRNLSKSIKVGVRLKPSQKRGKREPVELYVGTTHPTGAHGHLVEFGAAHMAAQPFLRPAWDMLKEGVLKDIEIDIWKAISKTARTLARKAERGTLSKAAKRALGG